MLLDLPWRTSPFLAHLLAETLRRLFTQRRGRIILRTAGFAVFLVLGAVGALMVVWGSGGWMVALHDGVNDLGCRGTFGVYSPVDVGPKDEDKLDADGDGVGCEHIIPPPAS